MSLLPTAHAGQAFGARRIDFFTVSGDVVAADAAAGRIRDDDGMEHDIRLLERTETLKPGDNATVLRVQAGPNRRSRPVAVVNHSRGSWVRTAPDATALLARSGVTRGMNWWLSVAALVLTAIASVWPLLHAFLTEMNGAMMSGVPDFDVYAELNMLVPSLAGWRLEEALSAGLLDSIASLNLVETGQLTEWGLAAGGLLLGAAAYFARSWRLVYVPVFAGFALAAGGILGGPEATLALTGGALLLFLLGGLVNRIRDAGRFNARVERLAEHVLRNPPQEGIRPSETAARERTAGLTPAAAAASAIAAAAAVAEGPQDEDAQHEDAGGDASAPQTDPAQDEEEAAAAAAAPGDDAANGEVEAGPSLELPPSQPSAAEPAASAAPEQSGEAAAAIVGQVESAEAAIPPSGGDEDALSATDTAEPVAAESADETEAGETETGEAVRTTDAPTDAPAGDMTDDTAAAMAALAAAMRDEQPDDGSDTETPPAGGTGTSAAPAAVDDDDDLPSLDAVAAAAALSAAERGTPAGEGSDNASGSPAPAGTEDERTMPLASPPPMPAAAASPDEAAGDDAADSAAENVTTGAEPETAPSAGTEAETAAEPAAPVSVETVDAETAAETGAETDEDDKPTALAPAAASDRLAEVETRVEAAVDAASQNSARTSTPATLVDDPLMDDGPDPMLPHRQAGDFAPGAPDLEVEPDPAE